MSISVPRERLQDGTTAIRALEAGDLPALVEARVRNRAFLTEWEPTRDVRATTLLAILVALPFAFLALIPSGVVDAWVYDVVRIASAIFPFKPALDAINAGLNNASPGLGKPLLHLAILAAAYTAIARVGLRRFA